MLRRYSKSGGPSTHVTILGGGPAGASAAISALGEGAAVTVIDKSAFPRHKVCGEFFSPETASELEGLGVWQAFQNLGPAQVRRMELYFGTRSKVSRLRECAWGLSRYAFDVLLLEHARAGGAQLVRELPSVAPAVIATGRQGSPMPRGKRLFGFKAHFEGPATDAVELYFFAGGYVGLTPIEGGRTNVCGLARESCLSRVAFEYDALLEEVAALRQRTSPLQRISRWYTTGPLQYGQRFDATGGVYACGDSLSFVDPFTGSGLLCAIKTGALAGRSAARGEPVAAYLSQCRYSLGKPFSAASIVRRIVESGWADYLVTLAPSRLLFALTRPR